MTVVVTTSKPHPICAQLSTIITRQQKPNGKPASCRNGILCWPHGWLGIPLFEQNQCQENYTHIHTLHHLVNFCRVFTVTLALVRIAGACFFAPFSHHYHHSSRCVVSGCRLCASACLLNPSEAAFLCAPRVKLFRPNWAHARRF